jgi:hypothetical protein
MNLNPINYYNPIITLTKILHPLPLPHAPPLNDTDIILVVLNILIAGLFSGDKKNRCTLLHEVG